MRNIVNNCVPNNVIIDGFDTNEQVNILFIIKMTTIVLIIMVYLLICNNVDTLFNDGNNSNNNNISEWG